MLRRIGQLREPERFAGWLRQVAVRMAINRATRRVSPPSVEVGILEGAASEHSDEPLDQLISRERSERLWAALGRLKALDREALDAFYIRGHSLLEIAEMLDVPLGTVKRRLHTARKRLKARARSLGRRRPGVDRLPGRRPPMTSSMSPSPSWSAPDPGNGWRGWRVSCGGRSNAFRAVFPPPATHHEPPRRRLYSSASRRYRRARPAMIA